MRDETLSARYRLTRRLGAGGMGVVWQAYDQVLDRDVAVKLLAPQFARDAEFRRRILAEARAAGRLSHPHIASVYDYGETTGPGDPLPFVVMELLHGRSLEQRLKRGPIGVEPALRICAEVASALAAAHARDVVHRDVKPGNVMLPAGGAKVVDFGLAAVAGAYDAAAGELVLGTPAYLAPERLDGRPVVAATDVYALALLLYRLLAGRLPWTAETSTQMLEAHVYLEPDPLPKLPGVPPVVRELLLRCLDKEPDARPVSREVTVTLARAAGVHVPLDGVDDDEPDDDEEEAAPGPGTTADRRPPRAVTGGRPRTGPFAKRVGADLDVALDHVDLRRQASAMLRETVGFDLAIWAVLDPVTLMWAACVVDGGPHDESLERELFANEYGQDDVLRLVDLAGDQRVGTLDAATHGDPALSPRFRGVLLPRGFTDELRASFHDADGTWGALFAYRAGGRFTSADVAQVAPAGRLLGAALHNALARGRELPPPPPPTPSPGPAEPAPRVSRFRLPRQRRTRRADLAPAPAPATAAPDSDSGRLTLSPDGRLLDVTASARGVLDAGELDRVGTAVAKGRRTGLVDTSGGRWLAFHAVDLDSAIAVSVGRIRPHEISAFVVQARGLQPWHGTVLGAVARGRDTRQIARELGLSVYAVEDGLTALLTAFRAGGRAELLTSLFFDHYVPFHASDVILRG
ncbi:Serine/threonine protein kinase [Asanoa hainanensis]|uniref:non-specific serine/threonine protein kinase n=1 Tax=Asanoa hainanensis TaxID=560556 RepID=A0A239NJ88_9ACTN|nr:protein kinase [Asanoa hainanensis]SNT54840.1 Serine/threonine protein kinase [Asanoa hainanensis]